MAAEWLDTTLGEFVRLQRGHDLTEVERHPGQVPIMGSAGHNGLHDTAKATGPGVVIGRSGVGSMGVVTYCPTDYWPHNTVLYITDFLGNDERFTYYFLHHLNLRRFDSGSAQASLNRNYIYPIRIRIPHPTEQRAIAHILGTLDDKIELNQRMNETLEAMARALFNSWFVNFLPVRANMEARNRKARTQTGDPVRAKAEGRDSGLPKPLDDLFPDSFEDSELGEIPKGWEVGTLGVLGELAIGGDWGEDHSFAGAVEANCLRGVDLEHLRESGQASPPRRWFKPSSLERRAIDDRDVLVAGSGAGPTGRPLWMCTSLVSALGPSIYSNFCKRIRCGTAAGALYLDAWLHEMRQSGEIWEHVNGTSVPNLDASSLLAGKEIPIPPIAVLDRYYGFVRPIREKLYSGQNRTLATLRDTLLPKLISGELRIEDAKRIIERATA